MKVVGREVQEWMIGDLVKIDVILNTEKYHKIII